MTIERYQRRAPSDVDLQQHVPSVPVLDKFGRRWVDVNLPGAFKTDLDEYMDAMGFAFVVTAPTDPVGCTLARFGAANGEPPTAAFATQAVRNDQAVLSFINTVDQSIRFPSLMPNEYGGRGVEATVIWVAGGTATTGDVKWDLSFERDEDGADIDVDGFAAAQSVTDTTPGTNGFYKYSTILFTAAQIDGVLAGELFRVQLTRDVSVGGNMADPAQVRAVQLRET